MANLELRIKSSADREALARNIIRKELVEKAENGDLEGIKELLTMISDEASQSKSKPRATVEVRNDLGQSLLSIAAQHDFEDLALFLLTYWKSIDVDRWDLLEGEISPEAKIFKANPNSRDLKGWTCVCIAVFHNSRKVLKLLLEHGGDPNIRSSYNRNAWDIARVCFLVALFVFELMVYKFVIDYP
jgi:ankyrin repeat protein